MRINNLLGILFTYIISASSKTDKGECYGGRPQNVDGLCPGQLDQDCDTTHDCDRELGYFCQKDKDGTSKCKGTCNLRAQEIQQTSIILVWNDFKPQNYLFEYSVAVTTKFNKELNTWMKREVGVEPTAEIEELVPGTLYFITVGIWSDSSFTKYSNTSEVVMVTTEGVESCTHNGKEIDIGGKIQIECEDICTCLPTGEMECEPVCHQEKESSTEPPDTTTECHTEMSQDGCCTFTKCISSQSLLDKLAIPRQPEDYVSISMTNISMTDALIKLTYNDPPRMKDINLCIRMVHHQNSTMKIPMELHEYYVQIRHLKPTTSYALWVEFIINENTELTSEELMIQTSANTTSQMLKVSDTTQPSTGRQNSGILLGLIGGIVGIIIALVLVFVIVLNHQRKRSHQTLSFENKLFGINPSIQSDVSIQM